MFEFISNYTYNAAFSSALQLSRAIRVKLHLRDGRTDKETQGFRASTTSTTIADVTPCRRRCDSSTLSRHKQTIGQTDAGDRICCILALKFDVWWQ